MTFRSPHPAPPAVRPGRARWPHLVVLLLLGLPMSWPPSNAANAAQKTPLQEHLEQQQMEFIREQARGIGEGIGQRAALQEQRRERIASLRQQLADCGGCAQRQTLQQSLDHWLATDRAVAEAERGALAGMGLGQYGSVDEMKAALNAGLAQWARQLEAEARQRKEISDAQAVVIRHCELKTMPELPAHCGGRPSPGTRHLIAQRKQACQKQHPVAEILADDQTVRQLCGRTSDAAGCIRQNSLLARMAADNAATLAQLRVRLREQRQADEGDGRQPPARVRRAAPREEAEERERERQAFAERLAAAKTREEAAAVRQEQGQRARERNAERVAQRAEARRLEQGCDVR